MYFELRRVVMKTLHIICVLCIFSFTLLSYEVIAKESTNSVSKIKNGKHAKKHLSGLRRSSHKERKTYMSTARQFIPLNTLSTRQIEAIDAYNKCIGNDHDDPLRRAMELAYEYKGETSLKGTPEKLGRESCIADMFGLSRYETIGDINNATKSRDLVIVDSPLIDIPKDIPLERRYARVWVRDYITTLAQDMQKYLHGRGIVSFHTRVLRVPSIVRSFDVQDRLVRNGRSPANCRFRAICSTHTTGSAIDISSRRIGIVGYTWLFGRLMEDRKNGKIVFILESLGGHFHVFVIPPKYVSWYAQNSSSKESSL